MRPASRAALACAIVATALLPPAHAQERGTTIAQRGGGSAATVSALDSAHGTVALATSLGTLTLKPSAEALARMKVGDPLLLKLELIDIGKSLDEKTN